MMINHIGCGSWDSVKPTDAKTLIASFQRYL